MLKPVSVENEYSQFPFQDPVEQTVPYECDPTSVASKPHYYITVLDNPSDTYCRNWQWLQFYSLLLQTASVNFART
ncbi:Kinesin-like protein KIN-13B, partial [Clarias magur]